MHELKRARAAALERERAGLSDELGAVFEALASGDLAYGVPKDTGSVYGQGYAGDMWRSMLSEQVSRQIAKSGTLGLSRRLFATHELPRASAEMSANALSAPESAEISKGAILFSGAKRT